MNYLRGDRMELEQAIKKIEDHFKDLTVEQFEENLVECGIEVIESSKESGWQLV